MSKINIEDLDGVRVMVGALFMAARIANGISASRAEHVARALEDTDAFLIAAAEVPSSLEAHFGNPRSNTR